MKGTVHHYRAVFEPSGDGSYWAFVPELPGCFTYGETLEETEVNVRDAIAGYLRVVMERGIGFPKGSEAALVKEVEVGF